MEVIELPSYTEDEKVEIAERYLVKRQLEANGLKPEQVEITEGALRTIVREYTREAGVRNLERQIGGVLRNVAVRIAEGTAERVRLAPDDVRQILGAQVRERGRDPHLYPGRGDRSRLDPGRRRRAVRGGDPDHRHRQADPHRTAG